MLEVNSIAICSRLGFRDAASSHSLPTRALQLNTRFVRIHPTLPVTSGTIKIVLSG